MNSKHNRGNGIWRSYTRSSNPPIFPKIAKIITCRLNLKTGKTVVTCSDTNDIHHAIKPHNNCRTGCANGTWINNIQLFTNSIVQGRARAQAVSRRSLTAEARARSRVGPCGICGGRSGTGTGFSPSTSVFPCQFHSTGAPLKWKCRKKLHHLHHTESHNKPSRLRVRP